jgi:IS605 OrfB family transposase
MQATVCGKIFPSKEEAEQIDLLMKYQSACMRSAYKRMCEGKTKSEIDCYLENLYPDLNTRYRKDGYFRALINYKAALKLEKIGLIDSVGKVIFGGRKNLQRREQGKLTSEEWKQLRNNQLFSRGDKSKKGNLNLRFMKLNGQLFLRVNTGNRIWINIPAYLPKYVEEIISGVVSYGVRIIRKNGSYELRVNRREDFDAVVGFKLGAVGVDFNHNTVDLAVTNNQGQLKAQRTIYCHSLTYARRGKREWLIGNLVKQVVRYAKYWKRGLVIENLRNVTQGQSNQHQFSYRKFSEALKRRAEREGVQIRIVNPAYTSIIGRWKYAPYYHITVHQSAALVIARRGQGFTEHLRKLKTLILEPMEGGKVREQTLNCRVHAWCLWRKLGSLPSRQGTNFKHSNQPYKINRMESWRTRSSLESSLDKDNISRGKIVIPGNGPSQSDVKKPHIPPKMRSKGLSTRPKS